MVDRIPLVRTAAGPAVPVHPVTPASLPGVLQGLAEGARRFAEAQGFKAEAGRHLILPDADGGIGAVLLGLGSDTSANLNPLQVGKLATVLPAGTYRLAEDLGAADLATLGFALGGYRFERYRSAKTDAPRLVVPDNADHAAVTRIAEAIYLARDLINTPANDLSPDGLAEAAVAMAARFGAAHEVISGAALETGFPMIHAVGAGSDRPPCLIDLRWGSEGNPKVTLVGKGIVFDTGGLDIKPASGMLLMKKDMGGAANVLALASMIMDAGLRVRLRVLIPAAENSISGRAFRPGDVLRSRKGLTVEIGNTDAEGRLVLADALALADEESPDLLVTMSTLTGAARVALGPDMPPFYTDNEASAGELAAASAAVFDPIWRLPFWKPYDAWLASKVADVNHVASGPFAGSIVAALFLRRFVAAAGTFAHFDIYGWNPSARPWGPEGGEAQAVRALFHHLSQRYA